MDVSKGTKDQNSTEITLVTDASKQYLLSHLMFIGRMKIFITFLLREASLNNNFFEALTTSILVKGLPLTIMQA